MSRGRRDRRDDQPEATGFDSRESRRSRRSGGPDDEWQPGSRAVVDGWPSARGDYGGDGGYVNQSGHSGSGSYQGSGDGYSGSGSYPGQGGYPGIDSSSPGSYQNGAYQENGYGNGAYGGAGRPDDAYGAGGYDSYRGDDYSDPGYGRGQHSGSGYPGGHSGGFGQLDRYAGTDPYSGTDPYAGPDAGASGPYSQPDPRGATDPRGLTDPFGRTDPRGMTDPFGRTDPGRHTDQRGTAGSSSGALEPYRGGSGYNGSGYNGSGYDRTGYERPGYDDGGQDQRGYGALEPYDGAGHGGAGHGGAGYGGASYDSGRYESGGYDRAGRAGAGYGSAGYDNAGYDSAGYDSAGYAGNGYEGDSRSWAGQGERGYGGADGFDDAGGPVNRGGYSDGGQYGTAAYSSGGPYDGHDATGPGVGQAGQATGSAYGGGYDDRDYESGWGAGQQDQYSPGEGGYGAGSYPGGQNYAGEQNYAGGQNYAGEPDQLADSGPSSTPGRGSRYDWQAPLDDTGMTRRRNRGEDEIDADDARHNNFFRGFGRGDDDYTHRPPKKRRRSRAGMVALCILVLFLAGIVAGGAYGYKWYEKRHANFVGSGYGSVLVQVKPGAIACGATLENTLVNAGVVASATAFCDAAKAASNSASLEPGFFRLHKHMSAKLAWAMLVNPKSRVQTNAAVPDGLRVSKVIALLADETHIPLSQYQLVLKNDVSQLGLPSWANGNPEGFLYPATYPVQPGTTALEVLKTMVAKFNSEISTINLPREAKAGKLTEYQVIKEASLLEAEVGAVPQYFPEVAGVIDNRLNDHWYLGLNSTVAYALNKYSYNFTESQLHSSSPYNTMNHYGLPPGPIDSPDLAAIKAVLHPTHTTAMYFVTINKAGKTLFTDSQSQFNAWAQEAARNGV